MTSAPGAISLSVAMCTYNGERFLPAQLSSIAAQSRQPDELVICDDASTDGTMAVLTRFAREAEFPVHVSRNPKNLGSTKNFENAIRACSGDVIALCDQDDVWHVSKLARLSQDLLRNDSIGMVFSDAQVVSETLEPLGYQLWDGVRFTKREQRAMFTERGYLVLLKHNVVTGATMAFRNRFSDLLLPIPTPWVHDGWIAIVLAAVSSVKPVPETLIQYRQHVDSQIGVKKLNVFDRARYSASSDATGVRASAADRAKVLYSIADSFALVAERLSCVRRDELKPGLLTAIDEKVEHLRTRAELSTVTRPKRVAPIAKEIFAGKYRRHSYGFWSAMKDVALR